MALVHGRAVARQRHDAAERAKFAEQCLSWAGELLRGHAAPGGHERGFGHAEAQRALADAQIGGLAHQLLVAGAQGF
ncbi:hypothetical protein AWV80_01615 [Cupriavidus sp. UYMU48A]|nr:hypothetical protein AWV80_01615 [Cupriavidus sp. UYMU48A]